MLRRYHFAASAMTAHPDQNAAARRRLSDRCAEQERTIGELRERLAAVERGSTQLRNAVGRAAGVVR
ncbi:hypothetical protein CCR96_19625 [Halochromatium roseum]|nr:hypothetical protein [Halochromatium roseum]